ncbi:hypothetical protein RhiirC2_852878 [Rhizophagus irregularis]|uniref:Uncharacterized protein n=1 Tax=Rhizophagus irregularis TaxID=588596 RepID=A0A2N1MXP9_9GLOM|nr:hypothetical protein RhiirC2_852878 [Rhizophagus irregularis]
MEEREYVENKNGNIVPYITKENACEIHQILNDPNVLDMFFGSEEPPYVKQNLYIVVNEMPEIKLQSLGKFMIKYIEWGTFTENLPLNDPPQEALSSKDIEKFNNILDTELGDDFRSKHHNLIAISLYWKIRNELYENVPAIVFYVIRKNILPHNNTLFPENIGGFITDDLLRMLEAFNKLLMFRTENKLENEKKKELQVELEKLKALQIMLKLHRLECEFNKTKKEWNEISNTDYEFFKNKLSKKLKFLDSRYQTCIENKKKFESAQQTDTRFAIIEKGVRGNYEFGQYKYGVDAAIALVLTNNRELDPSKLAIRNSSFNIYNIPNIRLTGLKKNINDIASRRIFKVGRTTGLTEGVIKEVPVSVNTGNMMRRQVGIFHDVLMEGDKNKDIWLDRQILVKAKKGTFMDKGDSGCAWFDIDGNVIALGHGSIIIREMDYCVGSPINVVLKAFHPLELSLVV